MNVSEFDARDRRRAITATAVFASIAVSIWQSDVELGRLFDASGLDGLGHIASGFTSPDVSGDFLRRIARLAIESLFIGALGTGLALLIGVPLAIAAAQPARLPDDPAHARVPALIRAGIRAVARAILAVSRSVPEIIWAFLFVRIVGLGPGPAVLAIGITFGGIIGKLFAELLEAADPEPAKQLRASGAGRVGVFLYGRLPQVRRQWIGYALFRLECAIRSASILGVVGAGGLGTEIELSIRYFQYDKLATALLAVLAYVAVLELLSHRLRRAAPAWAAGFFALTACAAVVWLPIPWSDLWSSSAIDQARQFIGGFGHPTLDGDFLWNAIRLTLLTVAMAWSSTVLAACIAFVLAPLSATTFTVRGYLEDAPRGRGPMRWFGLALIVPARVILQITRALPELVWALIFILWVEPGPTAGVLALTVHTTGILGRLFSDVLEEAETGPPRALEAAGVGRLGRYLYGVLPQALPRLLSFTLFRFEVNIRAAAMVGFVGAGGLGDAIHTAISLFHWNDLAGLLLVLITCVVVVDAAGDRVRLKILSASGRGSGSRAA